VTKLDYGPGTSKGNSAQRRHKEKIVHTERKLEWGKGRFKKMVFIMKFIYKKYLN
jgi:hypothetical protein